MKDLLVCIIIVKEEYSLPAPLWPPAFGKLCFSIVYQHSEFVGPIRWYPPPGAWTHAWGLSATGDSSQPVGLKNTIFICLPLSSYIIEAYPFLQLSDTSIRPFRPLFSSHATEHEYK